jgi:hypothetical protein
MKTQQLKSVLLFTTVLLSAAWLVFVAYMILNQAGSHNGNGIVMANPSEGASFKIDNGIFKINNEAGLLTGTPRYHWKYLIPALSVPFGWLVFISLYGCYLIGKKSKL